MSYKSNHWCIVPECKNTTIMTSGKLWIKMPNDLDIRQTWLKLVGRDPNSLSVKSPLYLCEDHFDLPNDMENYMEYHLLGSVSKVKMKPGILPTKFDCQLQRRKRPSASPTRLLPVRRQRNVHIYEAQFEQENVLQATDAKEKRAHRKVMEKKRRDRLKSIFANLKKTIPSLQNEKSPSRNAILKKATDHIIFMKKKNAAQWKDLEILKKENSLLETQISAMENDNSLHENGKFEEVKVKAKEEIEEFCELSDSSDSDYSYPTVNKSKKLKVEGQV